MEEYFVQGFKASAVAAGLKKDGGLDLALICSEGISVSAGAFTLNQVKAAPVILSGENIENGAARAIIANSGNANACSGKEGLEKARRTALLVARELHIPPDEVLVASTGVIGAPPDMDRISGAISSLVRELSPQGIPRASQAIMTTDSFPKMSRFEGEAGGIPYRIVGMAKGAGMIMPNMATMLCFLLTDIKIDLQHLRKAISSGVRKTFNRISVDGDTSTNDMVLALANGAAENGPLSPGDFEVFEEGMTSVMNELATMIVRDGEGATKLVLVRVAGAASEKDALTAVRTIANSSLVKTAFYGQDPNWGRIMAALGRSDIHMKEEDVSIWIDDVQIVEGGLGKGAEAEREAANKMGKKAFTLTVDLHQGGFEDRMMTCDLTHDYVSINANYRT
ncbi:MAG: bifunctional glutamate N-acetyltransferase/amino-acid acetyltransferase ArgJ [Pseudomonadota bacterium]